MYLKTVIAWILLIGLVGCQSTFYVVRHAEKAAEPRQDPPLTKEGVARAQRLKEILMDKKIQKVYSSDFIRTRETARPTAEKQGITIAIYNPVDQTELIEVLKQSKKNTLIVGHSNTIRHVINGLYEQDTLKKDLEDSEYNHLFVIKRKRFPIKKQLFEKRAIY